MLLKRVIVYNNGREVSKFDCAVCDFSNRVLTFAGVVRERKCRDTLHFVGSTYIEIDRLKRECLVNCNNSPYQFFITW